MAALKGKGLDSETVLAEWGQMLRFKVHPIRPDALTVLARHYRVGTVAKSGDVWDAIFNPNFGPPHSVAVVCSEQQAQAFVRRAWVDWLAHHEVERARLTVRAILDTEYVLQAGALPVGRVQLIPAGTAAQNSPVYRWSIGDAFGWEDTLKAGISAAEKGWRSWLATVGARPQANRLDLELTSELPAPPVSPPAA